MAIVLVILAGVLPLRIERVSPVFEVEWVLRRDWPRIGVMVGGGVVSARLVDLKSCVMVDQYPGVPWHELCTYDFYAVLMVGRNGVWGMVDIGDGKYKLRGVKWDDVGREVKRVR